MLVDNITLTICAGNGGNGAATFHSDVIKSKGGPDGGNGGNGGNIYFQGSHNLTDLRQFRYQKKITAANGIHGRRNNMDGKNASHLTIYLPLGTRIKELDSAAESEITDTTQVRLMAVGGKGGRGNTEFKSAVNQSPLTAEPGGIGQKRKLYLELRIIAEVGLVGLPNAGKSSLLAKLTNAKPLIGDYPFTTLEPNIGMMGKHPIADIPGLIEGAAHGKGLGVTFLRHIEKTKILIHCIDLAQEDPPKAYRVVREEFKAHNPQLLEKSELIFLTKADLVDEKIIKKYSRDFKKSGSKVLSGSIYDQKSLDLLKKTLEKTLTVGVIPPHK